MDLLGYYTDGGLELSAKMLTGTPLQITRVAAGDGATSLSDATLVPERQTLAVSPLRRSGSTATLPVTLAAVQAQTDYSLTEVGVYAEDPDRGEILYRIYRLSQPVQIRAGDSLVIRFELRETVGESCSITVSCTAAGLVTVEDLESYPFCTYGTEDLQAGVTPLPTGRLHVIYE